MAIYRIIMKDKTYFKLVAICSKLNKTPGKLLNELVDKFVEAKYSELFEHGEAEGRGNNKSE